MTQKHAAEQKQARVVEVGEPDGRWDPYVRGHARATANHLAAWARILAKAYGFQPRYLALEDPSGAMVGAMPVVYARGLLSGPRLTSMPALRWAGPIADSKRGEADLISAACDLVDDERPRRLGLVSMVGGYEELVPGLGTKEQPPSWRLPLPGDPEQYRRALKKRSKGCFYNVKWSKRDGVVVREAHSAADLRVFYRLYLRTMRRLPALPRPFRKMSLARELLGPEIVRLYIAEIDARSRRRLDLGLLPEGDPALGRIATTARRNGYRTIVRTIARSPFVTLDGDWDSFEARLTSKRRSDLRRRRRRLSEQGSCRFDCEDGSERLAALVAEGFEVEQAGWAGRNGTPIAARADTRVFYQRIAEWAAKRGCLRLFFLRLDGTAIAFAYCLVDADSLCVLKLGFHPSQARLAPGLLLTREMLAHAFGAGYRTYEFLGQVEPYKMIWTERYRDRLRVQAFPPTATGRAAYLAWKRGRPIAKWVLRVAGQESRQGS